MPLPLGVERLKITSWNVNGIVSCRRKGLLKFLATNKPDIACLQEVKTKCPLNVPGYLQFWNPAKRPGYAGTLTLAKKRAAVLHLWAGPGELGRRRPTDFSGVQRFLYSECLCGLLRLLYGAELQEDGQVSAEGDIPYQFMRENGYAVVGNQIILDYYHPANQYPSILNYYTVCGLYQQTLKSK